jgi:hypothetical protein
MMVDGLVALGASKSVPWRGGIRVVAALHLLQHKGTIFIALPESTPL